jgi:hypothetical protein
LMETLACGAAVSVNDCGALVANCDGSEIKGARRQLDRCYAGTGKAHDLCARWGIVRDGDCALDISEGAGNKANCDRATRPRSHRRAVVALLVAAAGLYGSDYEVCASAIRQCDVLDRTAGTDEVQQLWRKK